MQTSTIAKKFFNYSNRIMLTVDLTKLDLCCWKLLPLTCVTGYLYKLFSLLKCLPATFYA